MLAFRELAIATHLVGMVLWIGGVVAASVVAASAASASAGGEGEGGRAALAAARRAVLVVATPGMLLAWLAGLSYLVPNFAELYARAGWMHGKLTAVLVLTGLTGVLTGRLRRAAAGTKPASAGLFGGLALALIVGSAAVIFLAVLRPGA
jgi:putative membrane protein